MLAKTRPTTPGLTAEDFSELQATLAELKRQMPGVIIGRVGRALRLRQGEGRIYFTLDEVEEIETTLRDWAQEIDADQNHVRLVVWTSAQRAANAAALAIDLEHGADGGAHPGTHPARYWPKREPIAQLGERVATARHREKGPRGDHQVAAYEALQRIAPTGQVTYKQVVDEAMETFSADEDDDSDEAEQERVQEKNLKRALNDMAKKKVVFVTVVDGTKKVSLTATVQIPAEEFEDILK